MLLCMGWKKIALSEVVPKSRSSGGQYLGKMPYQLAVQCEGKSHYYESEENHLSCLWRKNQFRSFQKIKQNKQGNLTNDLLLSKKTSSFMALATAKLENNSDLSSRLEASGLLDLSASSSLAEA